MQRRDLDKGLKAGMLFVLVCRGWFGSTGSEVSISSSNSSVDMGGGGAAGDPGVGGAVERWGVFGPRLPVQSSASDVGPDSAAGNSKGLQMLKYNRNKF